MLSKIKNKKVFIISLIACVLICLFFSLLMAENVYATGRIASWIGDTITGGIATIIQVIIGLFGALLSLLMEVLVAIATYNEFSTSAFVGKGWAILRDLANMFFILGLLLIAFATVLKIEKYSYNRLLAKLLIMAILINFSRTISGLIIDFFQVLMLTFVKAFKDITAGNIFGGLKVTDLFKADRAPESGVDAVVNSLYGLLFVIITCIVVMIFAVILAFRIVALWILVVFSPIAFFSWIFEESGGQLGSVFKQWWSQFIKYCMIGPFLAFFLWLSLLSMATMSATDYYDEKQYDVQEREKEAGDQAFAGAHGKITSVLEYIFGIAMLVGGLSFAGKFGVMGSGYAAKGADWMKNKAQNTLERGARRAATLAAMPVTAPAGRVYRAAAARFGGTAAGIRAGIADRLLAGGGKSRVGRFLRATTKEGAEETRKLAMARARGRVGPRGDEAEMEEQRQTAAMKERIMAEPDVVNTKAGWQKGMKDALAKGDDRRARAMMEIGMEKGFAEEGDVNNYAGRFVGKGKKYADKKDSKWIRFTEGLEKKYHEATGDVMPLNEYYIDEEGQVQFREDHTPHKEIMTEVGKMDTNAFKKFASNRKVGNTGIFESEDAKKNSVSRLMALAARHDDTGRIDRESRNHLAQMTDNLTETDEGRKILQELIDTGQVEEKDLDNLQKFRRKLGAEYQANFEVVPGTDAVTETNRKPVERINSFKAKTKSATARSLNEDNVINNVGAIDATNVDTIASSVGSVNIDRTAITPTGDTEADNRRQAVVNEADEERKKILAAAYINQRIAALSDNDRADETKVKRVIGDQLVGQGLIKVGPTGPDAAGQEEINKYYNKQRRGQLSNNSVREMALNYQIEYGNLENKLSGVQNSIKSETHEDTLKEFDDDLAKLEVDPDSVDEGDLDTSVEITVDIQQQIMKKFQESSKKYNVSPDKDFEKAQKKLKNLFDNYKKAKGKDKKKDIANEINEHIQKVNLKIKMPELADGYFSGENKNDQIRKLLKELGQIDKIYDAEFYKQVKKEMKKMGKKDYAVKEDLQKAIEEALKT